MKSAEVVRPRCGCAAPTQGGDAGGRAEPDPRRLLGWGVLVLGVVLSGCASGGLREMVGMAPAAVVNPAGAKAEAAGSANAAKPAEPAKPAADVPLPVSPATQRAYDDARRLLAAGRTAEAERAFVALTKSAPDLSGPHANLGVIYRQTGKLPEAVAQLEKAAALSPQQAVVFNQLGVTYREQGQFEKARDAYERAIELDAQYAAPVLNLGILNDLYLRDSARALSLYDRYQAMTGGKDATVAKWMADLKNRKPAVAPAGGAKKEQS